MRERERQNDLKVTRPLKNLKFYGCFISIELLDNWQILKSPVYLMYTPMVQEYKWIPHSYHSFLSPVKLYKIFKCLYAPSEISLVEIFTFPTPFILIDHYEREEIKLFSGNHWYELRGWRYKIVLEIYFLLVSKFWPNGPYNVIWFRF